MERASRKRRFDQHCQFFRKLRRLAHQLQIHQEEYTLLTAQQTPNHDTEVRYTARVNAPRGRTLTEIKGVDVLHVTVKFLQD